MAPRFVTVAAIEDENLRGCTGPVADAHEWQLTGCLNFLSEITLNLTGTNGSIVPVTVGHGLKKQSLKLVDGNQ